MPRARANPTSRFPHCLWTMVDTMLVWWCEPIIKPRSKITSAGIGLSDTCCVRGTSQAPSDVA